MERLHFLSVVVIAASSCGQSPAHNASVTVKLTGSAPGHSCSGFSLAR